MSSSAASALLLAARRARVTALRTRQRPPRQPCARNAAAHAPGGARGPLRCRPGLLSRHRAARSARPRRGIEGELKFSMRACSDSRVRCAASAASGPRAAPPCWCSSTACASSRSASRPSAAQLAPRRTRASVCANRTHSRSRPATPSSPSPSRQPREVWGQYPTISVEYQSS